MRRYDNYDYEEAFKKYIDDTEEERLEKLLKEGKVNCLYRTATTKCTNIKSQTTLLEAQIYPSYPRLSDMPKTKKRPSSKAQKNLNDKKGAWFSKLLFYRHLSSHYCCPSVSEGVMR